VKPRAILNRNDRLSGERVFCMAEIPVREWGWPRKSWHYTYIVSDLALAITYAVSLSIQIANMKQ